MNKSNKGFSYIEMILVVSISAILVGMITLTMSSVNKNNVSKSANKLELALARCQTLCMAKGSSNGAISLVCENGKYYYYFGNNFNDKTMFCQNPCTVTLTSLDGSVVTPLSTSPCVISFKNTTGGLDTSITPVTPIIYSRVTIENSGKYRADLSIDKITGNVEYTFISY